MNVSIATQPTIPTYSSRLSVARDNLTNSITVLQSLVDRIEGNPTSINKGEQPTPGLNLTSIVTEIEQLTERLNHLSSHLNETI